MATSIFFSPLVLTLSLLDISLMLLMGASILFFALSNVAMFWERYTAKYLVNIVGKTAARFIYGSLGLLFFLLGLIHLIRI